MFYEYANRKAFQIVNLRRDLFGEIVEIVTDDSGNNIDEFDVDDSDADYDSEEELDIEIETEESEEEATAEDLDNFKKAFSVRLEAKEYMVKY